MMVSIASWAAGLLPASATSARKPGPFLIRSGADLMSLARPLILIFSWTPVVKSVKLAISGASLASMLAANSKTIQQSANTAENFIDSYYRSGARDRKNALIKDWTKDSRTLIITGLILSKRVLGFGVWGLGFGVWGL